MAEDHIPNPSSTCVVIGGQTFVGRFLVLRLLKLGNWIVRIADSSPSLNVEQNSLVSDAVADGRVSYFQVDVRDKSQLVRAVDGSSVIFVAETSGVSQCNLYESYMFIVQGAKNVINACRECKVKRLIYNSSADVVFDGSHHIRKGDESMPYPWKYTDMLMEMKAQAEALVLYANNHDDLLTCVLRPSNIFGPSDTHLVHAMVNQANSVWAKFVLGSGDNLSDFTYVENVAHAHICAAEALISRKNSVAGKAFFITNLEPRNYWEFVSRIYEGLGYKRPSIRVPPKIVNFLLPLLRWTSYKLESESDVKGLLVSVQFAIESSLFTRTFNCSAAKEHINYSPVVPLEEGIALTVKSFSHLAKSSLPSKQHQFKDYSKAEEILGYGKVADILLWRDEMETFTCFLITCGLFYWFLLSGRTFISSTAGLLLLAMFFLIVDSILPVNIFKKISIPCLAISEPTMRNMLDNVALIWNEGVQFAKTLAHGEDWSLFIKAAVILCFFKWISHSLTFLLGSVLVFAFTSFFIYEQYDDELDQFFRVVVIVAKSLLTLLLRSLPPSIISILSADDDLTEEQKQPVVK
ncbi:3beta-hydroxysteroid-dehydrogenase/decarboxylase-like [Chenopodium quinoa]|uniref:Reticulon-like protein n=1 Tax=Chenopodium quinoa TaxID=63459 RepID=A0A803KTJ2_CHEQI|nr:3beta-hydroxysteroid-dehydrogenase/decarboxylase-like [Chenopodium quinoa]